jgi:hypothetical protein
MKSKLSGTLVTVMLIAGIGCSHAVGGLGVMGSHDDMIGGDGTVMGPGSVTHDSGSLSDSQGGMGRQGIDQESDGRSGQGQGETGHGHGVPNTGGTTSNPQSLQAPGGPLSCH